MERPRWFVIVTPGDFRVESVADYFMVMQELAVVQAEESERLGAMVLAIYKTLGA